MIGPLIRACLSGFVYLHCDQAVLQEAWTVRLPGTTPPPFIVRGPARHAAIRELQTTGTGPVPCSWRADVDTIGGQVAIDILPDTSLGLAQAISYDPEQTASVSAPAWSPCDVNVDGAFNIYDFVDFLNEPFDFNADGSVDAGDYAALVNACGGG